MIIVTWLSAVMLTSAALLTAVHVMRSRTLPDRAIGIDMLVAVVLNGLAVYVAFSRDELLVTLLLIIGLLSFLGSVTIARFIERRGL